MSKYKKDNAENYNDYYNLDEAQSRYKYDFSGKKEKKKKSINKENFFWRMLLIGIVILSITFSLFGITIKNGIMTCMGKKPSIHFEKYKNAKYKLSIDGEEYSKILESGEYIVGKDIPEGIYNAIVLKGNGRIEVKSKDQNISINEFLTEKFDKYYFRVQYLDDIRLYQGANVTIEDVTLELSSHNARLDKME